MVLLVVVVVAFAGGGGCWGGVECGVGGCLGLGEGMSQPEQSAASYLGGSSRMQHCSPTEATRWEPTPSKSPLRQRVPSIALSSFSHEPRTPPPPCPPIPTITNTQDMGFSLFGELVFWGSLRCGFLGGLDCSSMRQSHQLCETCTPLVLVLTPPPHPTPPHPHTHTPQTKWCNRDEVPAAAATAAA